MGATGGHLDSSAPDTPPECRAGKDHGGDVASSACPLDGRVGEQARNKQAAHGTSGGHKKPKGRRIPPQAMCVPWTLNAPPPPSDEDVRPVAVRGGGREGEAHLPAPPVKLDIVLPHEDVAQDPEVHTVRHEPQHAERPHARNNEVRGGETVVLTTDSEGQGRQGFGLLASDGVGSAHPHGPHHRRERLDLARGSRDEGGARVNDRVPRPGEAHVAAQLHGVEGHGPVAGVAQVHKAEVAHIVLRVHPADHELAVALPRQVEAEDHVVQLRGLREGHQRRGQVVLGEGPEAEAQDAVEVGPRVAPELLGVGGLAEGEVVQCQRADRNVVAAPIARDAALAVEELELLPCGLVRRRPPGVVEAVRGVLRRRRRDLFLRRHRRDPEIRRSGVKDHRERLARGAHLDVAEVGHGLGVLQGDVLSVLDTDLRRRAPRRVVALSEVVRDSLLHGRLQLRALLLRARAALHGHAEDGTAGGRCEGQQQAEAQREHGLEAADPALRKHPGGERQY
mmetsp:Transcript_93394/g.247931  ORF Transcript_93394/g.247931 Transcript_93394/m.247931 type:complete len:508 (-) Transcript_93394:23-1546(-)